MSLQWELTRKGHKEAFLLSVLFLFFVVVNRDILYLHRISGSLSDRRKGYVSVYIYQNHRIVLLRSENFTGCKFFFNEKNHISKEWQSWNFQAHLNSSLMLFSLFHTTLINIKLCQGLDYDLGWYFWLMKNNPIFVFLIATSSLCTIFFRWEKKEVIPFRRCNKLLKTAGMPINTVAGSVWT